MDANVSPAIHDYLSVMLRLTRRKYLRLLALAGGSLIISPRPVFAASPKTEPMKTKAVVLDVIETLFDITPLEQKLQALGLPEGSLQVWFPRVLRDAFALQVIGTYRPFGEIATGTLEVLLLENNLPAVPETMQKVISAFASLPLHEDVREGIEFLRKNNVRVACLTNGSADTTRQMFRNAGIEEAIEKFIAIDEVKQWKPAAAVYHHAARTLAVSPGELALIAAHGWDIAGAAGAGLKTGYLARKQPRVSPAMRQPDVSGRSLAEVAGKLL